MAICQRRGETGRRFFRLHDFIARDGAFGIGSDPILDLTGRRVALGEYGQRGSINNVIRGHCEQTALASFYGRSGARWPHFHPARLHDDYLILDAEAPALAGVNDATLYDRLVFGGNRSLIKDVFVAKTGGRRWLEHRPEKISTGNYSKGLNELRRLEPTLLSRSR